MNLFKWIKSRILHKVEHLKIDYFLSVLKKEGPALFIIVLAWEIIEDILFPLFFGFLGKNVNKVFYAAIPVSWVLCLHWLAVPIIWGVWVKIRGKEKKLEMPRCDHDH